jgi:hypothetical protein
MTEKAVKSKKCKRAMIKVFLRTFSSAVYFGNPLFEKVKKKPLETDFFKMASFLRPLKAPYDSNFYFNL